MADIELRINYIDKVNYVLAHNNLSVCNSLEIINHSDKPLHNVQIECSGELFQTYRTSILPVIQPNSAVRLDDFVVMPNFAELSNLTERITSQFEVTVWTDVNDPARKDYIKQECCNITLMPYDQWLGIHILPQALVSYVTPNHPAVLKVLQKAAKIMDEESGNAAFCAYQTGDSRDVIRQVDAVFRALHSEGIVYRPAPASFEESGQRITLPDKVLSSRLGNCIELTLLMASVLESIGINSMVILIKGHAFLGVWLVDSSAPYCVIDDESFLHIKCADGIGEMIPIETTHLTVNNGTLKTAIDEGMKHINKLDTDFDLTIDVHQCRLSGVRALPQTVDSDPNWMENDLATPQRRM